MYKAKIDLTQAKTFLRFLHTKNRYSNTILCEKFFVFVLSQALRYVTLNFQTHTR